MIGGQWLGRVDAGPATLMVGFIAVTMVFNLFMGSMSTEYALCIACRSAQRTVLALARL